MLEKHCVPSLPISYLNIICTSLKGFPGLLYQRKQSKEQSNTVAAFLLRYQATTMARMNRPAPVEVRYKAMRFLITHNPTNSTLEKFLEILNHYEADTVVRVCESTYDKERLTSKGIQVMDWAFDDGAAPPKFVVENWLKLLKSHIKQSPDACIAVHCVAGLGRAPVLVAVALMESGMRYEDAVEFIREKRRGAINTKQLQYLESYRPRYCLGSKDKLGCSIM